jgi:hypothetical protein
VTAEQSSRTRRIAKTLREDAAATKDELWGKLTAVAGRPINLAFVVVGVLLYMTVEYVVVLAMDSLVGVDTPAQVEMLSADLQATSQDLQQSAEDIKALVAELDSAAATDPVLQGQLQELQQRLGGLTDLVEKTSVQTDKVASLSEDIRADWQRVQEATNGRIDGVPDLVLGVGEAVKVCDGQFTAGVLRTNSSTGQVEVQTSKRRRWFNVGQRVSFSENAYIDFLGLSGSIANFKLYCPND